MTARILALVGSLRAGSYNKQLAEAAVKYAPDGVDVDIFDNLADVAFYNEDIDRPGAVAAADRLRVEVQSADALLLVTPEYNGSIPASLKNAIDWISRPHGAGVISGKPLAVIGDPMAATAGVGPRRRSQSSEHRRRERARRRHTVGAGRSDPIRDHPPRTRRRDCRRDAPHLGRSRRCGPQPSTACPGVMLRIRASSKPEFTHRR